MAAKPNKKTTDQIAYERTSAGDRRGQMFVAVDPGDSYGFPLALCRSMHMRQL
jgi:hypothetical protein